MNVVSISIPRWGHLQHDRKEMQYQVQVSLQENIVQENLEMAGGEPSQQQPRWT